ncbi:hypothetical protein [Clostridium sp. 001]|uniref:hypothetical protein n=1 Tax=Clostridium sp. 001 TaxID=1970093 RepID=UPI001C2B7BB3|nr:hypothetical protein [Clostridium sp. 001]QXE20047.1 hypothetical protein B5S50_15105 [Clostridium sp. 001]
MGRIIIKCKFFKIDPTSNVIIFAISTLISLAISKVAPETITSSTKFTQKILYYLFSETMISNVTLVYIIIFIWLLCTIIYSIYYKTLENKEYEIKILKDNNLELKNDLKTEAGKLLSRYSDLTKFKIRDILQENLKKFIDSKYIVESAQLYKYKYIPKKQDTIIQVGYDGGYVKEDININCIMQSYYTIPTHILENLNNIIELYKKLEESENDSEEYIFAIFGSIDRIAQNIISNLKNELRNKSKMDFEDKDIDLYAILKTIISILYEDEDDICNCEDTENNGIKIIEEIFGNVDINEIKLKKRTGIFQAILRKDYFIFQHDGLSDKNGRAYISKCLSLNEEKYVLLISCNPMLLSEDNWESKLLCLCCELEKILKNILEI